MKPQEVKDKLDAMVTARWARPARQCGARELYAVLLDFTKQAMGCVPEIKGKKVAYYLSMEFLVGRLLVCNLINLGLHGAVESYLREAGSSLADIEACEPEPSLGNGGLGRLAACYLDSAATLGIPLEGIGLCYHFGLFRQKLERNSQAALPNPWIESQSWLTPAAHRFEVSFGAGGVQAVMYDVAVPGYGGGAGRLRLFDLEGVDEGLVAGGGIDFDKKAVKRNLTLFLYPDDSDEAGRLLRVHQEYFLASCAAQYILRQAEERGSNMRDLRDYAVVQINDTHPSLVIPELIRLLEARGLCEDEAVEIVSGMCAYTNHTILAEALEKWSLRSIKKAAPQIVPVIQSLSERAKARCAGRALEIIDRRGVVHMARMDIHYGFSVNGVAALHTDILKKSELADFYDIYPEKFTNKTNGITFRRWLLACNGTLADFIEGLIGPAYKKDASELAKMMDFTGDENALERLLEIKLEAKRRAADFILEQAGTAVNADAVFDIQIKRLHEYKRQQLNALWLIRRYLEIKAGRRGDRRVVSVFGGKAAPAYVIAQDIIHLILCLRQLVNSDPEVSPYLKVVMVPNYNVSAAERLIPACDISEQISLASKEASGTGNMKFMLNGAVTLGTMDGANVEIAQLVGEENIYIFGRGSGEVMEQYRRGGYDPLEYYAEEDVGRLVDFIVGRELTAIGSREKLARLHRELIAKDWFMALPDARDYFRVKDAMIEDCGDRRAWARKMLANIAMSGFFSADRSVAEYQRDIWRTT